MGNSNEGKIWADILDTPEKRTVEEVIAKSLKERANKEKKKQNRRRNIIVLVQPESKKSEPKDRKEDKKQDIFQNFNKMRESEILFNNINIAHDLTKKQKEELQEKLKEAQEKEENSQGNGHIMSEVYHGTGLSKESPKEHFEK